jgi:hypothetical protein
MDSNLFGALSALLGSVVGASASLGTTWLTQRQTERQQRRRDQVLKRERLFRLFIKECARLQLHSLDHTLEDLSGGVGMIAALNEIRLVASPFVVEKAEQCVSDILESYRTPNLSIAELHAQDAFHKRDVLREFTIACRAELEAYGGN